MWKWHLNISLLLLFCMFQYSNGTDPLVQTNVGLIRGLRATDGDYSMFMGIPYASVNETNPFGPLIPYPVFDDIFEAYDDSAICPQIEEFNHTIVGSLDCLHINVYVPNSASPTNKMPVLVWIYGGGFTLGFAGRFLFGPKYLVRHDIILVTLNYRLGPYGFMCLDTPEVPGNQGLKDQAFALKWIKNNIEAFGGDSNKITIYGISAGGMSADFQLTYGDLDLFDKVILHSGNVLVPGTISVPDTSAPLQLAEHLGYLTSDINQALSFLATIDAHIIIGAVANLGIQFGVCIEKDFDNVEKFIHEHPLNVKDLDISNKSAILAFNRDELLLSFLDIPPEAYETMDLFRSTLSDNFNFNSEELNEMEAIVRNFYIGDKYISETVTENLIDFLSDFVFIYPTVRSIQRYIDYGATNTFCFVFSYDGERNYVKHRLNLTIEGVAHADDLSYVFDVSYMDEPTPDDQLAIDRITTLYANFVKYGNPTPERTDIVPVQWLPVTKDTIHYLELVDADVKVGQRYFNERMTFWDLFYRLNEEYEIGYDGNKN